MSCVFKIIGVTKGKGKKILNFYGVHKEKRISRGEKFHFGGSKSHGVQSHLAWVESHLSVVELQILNHKIIFCIFYG